MPETLFVYGTLHPGRAPRALADLVAQFRPLGPATVHGHLLQLGDYPGLTLDPAAPAVSGNVFQLPEAPDLWPRLDAYEDYRPADEPGSLFLRRQTLVHLQDHPPLLCWIYLYNRAPPTSLLKTENS